MDSEWFLVRCTCAALSAVRVSRKNSKGLDEAAYGSSCDSQPLSLIRLAHYLSAIVFNRLLGMCIKAHGFSNVYFVLFCLFSSCQYEFMVMIGDEEWSGQSQTSGTDCAAYGSY